MFPPGLFTKGKNTVLPTEMSTGILYIYTKYIANVLVLLLISKICVYNIQEATVVAIEYVKIKGQGLNVVVAVVVLATQQLRCLIQGDFI